MLLSIDPLNLPKKAKLFLCKPNREIISRLNSSHNITLNLKLGSLSELTLSIPTKIEANHILIKNPDLDKIKDRYNIKVEYNNLTIWFLINEITDSMDSDSKTIHAFSAEREIADKFIRLYTSKNAESVDSPINCTKALTDALSESIWSVNSVPASFDIKYRSFDVSSKTALDFCFEIATTFDGVLVFNTENRTVSIYEPESVGLNKGLKCSYGKLLNTADLKTSSDTMVTKLSVFGKDNLSIAEVNPIGSDFIENLTFFKNLDYMSQGLIDAQNLYEVLLETNKSTFSSLLSDLESKQIILTAKQTELDTLQTEMDTIEDSISIAQTVTPPLPTTDLLVQKETQQQLIDAKNAEIVIAQSDINGVNTQRLNLQTLLSMESNFTSDQIKERNLFIIEKTLSNDSYTSAQDLYDYAKAEYLKINIPQIVATVSIVNFLEILELQQIWDKLSLGDFITIQYEPLGIDILAKIIEMSFNLEDGSVQLTIANEKDISNDKNKFLADLYKSVSTSASLDMSKYKYEKAYVKANEVQDILNATWDASKRKIVGGINESVVFDKRGITLSDPADANSFIRMLHNVIGLTEDGGNSFKTAILPSGIVAERLIGQIIAGQNLTIATENGKFLVNQDGVTIQDLDLLLNTTDGKSQIILNPIDGIKIQQKVGTIFEDKLYLDMDGAINAEDLITKNIKIKSSDGTKTLIDGALNKIDFTGFDVIGGKENVLKGVTVKDINNNTTFSVDEVTGKVTITGDVIMTGGSVSWLNVTGKPTIPTQYTNALALQAWVDSGYQTYINQYGVYTGTLTALQINAVQGITLGPTATINWSSVLSKPTIPTTAAQVGARPDTWMPTATDVGARPSTWLPTAAQVGARANDWLPTSAQVGALATNWVGATYIDSNGLYTGTIVGNKIYGGTISGVIINALDTITIQSGSGTGTITTGLYFGNIASGYGQKSSIKGYQYTDGTTRLDVQATTMVRVIAENVIYLMHADGSGCIVSTGNINVDAGCVVRTNHIVTSVGETDVKIYIGEGGTSFNNTADGVMRLNNGTGAYLKFDHNVLSLVRADGSAVVIAQ